MAISRTPDINILIGNIETKVPDSRTQEKALQFITNQFLEQSSMPSAEKRQIINQVESVIKGSGKFQDKWEVVRDRLGASKSYYADQFEEFSTWFSRDEGINFLQKDVSKMHDVDFSSYKSQAYVHSGYLGQDEIEQFEKTFRSKSTMNQHLTIDRGSAKQMDFTVFGQRQTSRQYQANINVPGINTPFKVNLISPSEQGFVGNVSSSVGALKTPKESIYAVGKQFITDIDRRGNMVRHASFEDFQAGLLKQLKEYIDNLKTQGRKGADVNKLIQDAVDRFNETILSQQSFAGSAAELQTYSSANKNALAQIVSQQERISVVPTFSQNPSQFQVGSKKLFETLRANDVEMALSSGQTGNVVESIYGGHVLAPKGVGSAVSYDPNYPFPSFREPHKMLGELTPLKVLEQEAKIPSTTINRIAPIMEGAYKEGVSDLTKKVFDPKGVNVLVGFVGNINSESQPLEISIDKLKSIYPEKTSEELEKVARSIKGSFDQSNLFLPDGTIVARESLAKDTGVGYMKSEKIKLSGAGGSRTAQVGDSIAAFLEGKTMTYNFDGKDISFTTTGLKESQGDMKAALTLKTFSGGDDALKQSFQEKLYTFGFPLRQGELLGLDQQGYQVSTENRANTRQFITSANIGDENLDLRVFQTTEQAMRDGSAANQVTKLTGGALNKGRLTVNYATDSQFEALTGLPKTVEGGMPMARLADPLERTYYQGAAARRSLSTIFDDLSAKGFNTGFLDDLRHLSTEELLSISHGQTPKSLGDFKGSAVSKAQIENLIGKMEKVPQGVSAEYRLAKMALAAGAQASGQNLEEALIEDVIQNIYAPHTKWGEKVGFGGMYDKESVFTSWGADAKPVNVQRAQIEREVQYLAGFRKTNTPEVNARALATAKRVLDSEKVMESLVTFGLRDDGVLLGMGQKAGLEPRYMDLAAIQPHLITRPAGFPMSPMEEITSRMTNFVPAIEELNKAVSHYSDPNLNMIGLQDYKTSDLVARNPVSVNLGFSEEQIKSINEAIDAGHPQGYLASNQVYMPSEENLTAMDKMKGGLSIEKEKPIREIYSNLFESIEQSRRTNAPVESFAKHFVDFQKDLQQMQKVQLMGQAGGGSHGLLRGPVQGSAMVYNMAFSGNLLESLGILDGGDKYQDDFFKTQQRAYFDSVQEQGMGRQIFATERTVNKQFTDAIKDAEEQMLKGSLKPDVGQSMIAGYKDSLARLHAGEGVGVIIGRDPAINTGSLTGAVMFMDKSSSYSKDVDAVVTGQQHLMLKNMDTGKEQQIGYSILNELAGDHDGDRPKLFILSRQNADQISQQLVETATTGEARSARTAAIKSAMVDTIGWRAEDFKLSSGLAATTPASIAAGSDAAKASPKTVVPKISNALSEMKFAISQSKSLKGTNAGDLLYNFLYATEQVPISGKHFSKQAEFGEEIISRFQSIRSKFLDPDKYEEAVDELFSLTATDKEGNLLGKTSYSYMIGDQSYQIDIDVAKMKGDLVTAGKELHSNEKNIDILKKLRSKASLEHVDQDDLMGMYRQMGENLEGVHYRASELQNLENVSSQARGATSSSGAGASKSTRALTQINEQIIESGTKSSQKSRVLKQLGGKNLAIAGGMIAAAGIGLGIAMSPTYVNKREHYIDPDYLFPEEFDKLDPNLHSKGLITPSAVVSQGGVNAQIHLPPGARIPENLAGRLGAMGSNAISSLTINDHRMSLDAHRIDKIKREII